MHQHTSRASAPSPPLQSQIRNPNHAITTLGRRRHSTSQRRQVVERKRALANAHHTGPLTNHPLHHLLQPRKKNFFQIFPNSPFSLAMRAKY